jgi:hypothetical protein
MPANDHILTALDTAMRAAWINAGHPTTGAMPAANADGARVVLAALDARYLQTAGHTRRLRMAAARGSLVVAMDAANAHAAPSDSYRRTLDRAMSRGDSDRVAELYAVAPMDRATWTARANPPARKTEDGQRVHTSPDTAPAYVPVIASTETACRARGGACACAEDCAMEDGEPVSAHVHMPRFIVSATGADHKPYGIYDRDRSRFVASYADGADVRDALVHFYGWLPAQARALDMDAIVYGDPAPVDVDVDADHDGMSLLPSLRIADTGTAPIALDDHASAYHWAVSGTREPATSAHEPVYGDDAAPVVSDDEMAPYSVQRAHTGTEDGSMWRVVDTDGSPVDGDWHASEDGARACAADMARVAALATTYLQRACMSVRDQCGHNPAAHGLAVVDADGAVVEYRIVTGARGDMDAAALLAMTRDDYSGEPVVIVTDGASVHEPAPSSVQRQRTDMLTRVDSIASDIAEIGSGEYSADTRAAYMARIADLRRELDTLPVHVIADVPTGTLTTAGTRYVALGAILARLQREDVSALPGASASGYALPVRALTAKHAGAVLTWARDFASDCMWTDADADSIAAMAPDDVIRCAARHYDGGIAFLVSDAIADMDAR